MSSQSDAQKSAAKYTKNSVPVLQQGKEDFLADPMFQALGDLIMGMIQDPLTMSDERLAPIKANMAGQAQQGAANAFQNMMAQMAGTGNARGGASVAGSADIASQLGNQLAGIEAQMGMQQLQSIWPDIMNALTSGSNLMQQKYGWDKDISNAYLGAGSTLTQLAGQPTPASGIFGGIGGLLGSAAGGLMGNPGLLGGGK